MYDNALQAILAQVQKPSRYLGTEINRVCKDPGSVELKVALAFPDLYDIGTSHFGLQILYHILNQSPEIGAERVFAPAKDMEEQLRKQGLPLFSLESRIPLANFDIIGFSLLYELNYTNVLNMLDLAGLPIQWDQRDDHHPLVIAGGPCVCNPEPVADFFDAMVFGDGEQVVLEMARLWLRWHRAGGRDKVALLRQWAQLQGVYVPRFYQAVYDDHGYQRLVPDKGVPTTIRRTVLADLDQANFPDNPVIPFGKPVHDRLRLEIARGCTRGCRFCQAGMIYRPVRERSPEKLFELTRRALAQTGYEDLSLLSLSTGDYTCLGPLMAALIQSAKKDHVAISLPSLRAGSLTPELMALIQSVRKTGFTIAPEAGSQRLRNVINKNICFDDVATTVRDAFALGWRVIKLYFMIGLPTETEKDLEAIVEMVQQLKGIKSPQGRRGQINVSVTTFIPKAHTPFQWAGQLSMAQSRAKITYLKSALTRIRGVHFKWQDPTMSVIEGVFARGDRRLGPVLIDAWKSGCLFDGWSDGFNFERWKKSFQRCGVDLDLVITRQRELDESLAWDHMDSGVDAAFLKSQWHDALAGKVVQDCRGGQCHQCGVCDFDTLQPVVFEACTLPVSQEMASGPETAGPFFAYELIYEKMGPARFFGHLEMGNLFGRAIRRATVPVAYSQGFHPQPKISFNDPLPLGIESQAEQMRLKLTAPMGCQELIERINPFLPQGVKLVRCRNMVAGERKHDTGPDHFRIVFDQPVVNHRQVELFWASDTWDYESTKPNGTNRKMDLRQCIQHLSLHDGQRLELGLDPEAPYLIRPLDVLVGVFALSIEVIQGAQVTKRVPRENIDMVDNPVSGR
jgi:radical SAM family uncharacterized protein/radical SAM-linked protein